MAVEAAATKILSLLGSSIVCVLNMKRRGIRHGEGGSSGRLRTIKGLMRRDKDGGWVLKLNSRSIVINKRRV